MKTAAATAAEPDEYELRPDELTKEQFAEKAGVSLRAVEGWKKDGKIEAEKKRRRVNGTVRQQLIFKAADVEQFLNGANKAVTLPTIDKPQQNALQTQPAAGLDPFAVLEMMMRQTGQPEPAQSAFITIAAASDFYGLAQAELHRLIASKDLRSFRGKAGVILISRRQIEGL